MEVKYELTEKDYIAFNLHHLTLSSALRRSMFLQRFVLSLIIVAAPLIYFYDDNFDPVLGISIFAFFYILWVIFYPKYFKGLIARKVSRLFREGKNAGLLGEHTISIGPAGLLDKSSTGETWTSWDAIERIAENNAYIFIYNSAVSAFIVPAKAFASEESRASFLNQVRTYSKR